MLESMVDDWGVTRHARGQDGVVPSSPARRRARRATTSPAPPHRRPALAAPAQDNVPVELQNMPLLLHAAWQEHAEALLREYLLASLDSDGRRPDPDARRGHGRDRRARGARARAAVALAADDLMGDAIEPHVSAAGHRGAGAARARCRTSRPSTGRSRPRSTCPRRGWCSPRRPSPRCRPSGGGCAVRCCGRPPAARRSPGRCRDDAPLGTRAGRRLGRHRRSREADHGVIAADQTSQILALSPEAARILGYDDPAELVGQRIVSIVPERYRQAHVAGFTMYLLVGRQAAARARPVVVPALRRDGSEVEVELLVRDHGVGDGRSVLLADIRPRRGLSPPLPRWRALAIVAAGRRSRRWMCARTAGESRPPVLVVAALVMLAGVQRRPVRAGRSGRPARRPTAPRRSAGPPVRAGPRRPTTPWTSSSGRSPSRLARQVARQGLTLDVPRLPALGRHGAEPDACRAYVDGLVGPGRRASSRRGAGQGGGLRRPAGSTA